MTYYRRRSYKKRRSFKRKSVAWYNKKYSAIQLASKAVAGVRYLKGLVNAELHKFDLTGSASISTAGNVFNLVNIANGDTDSDRTGNSIFVRYVNAGGMLQLNSSADNTAVRIMLVIDKQQVGDNLPTVTDILETVSSPTAPYSKLNSETAGRFTILSSRVYILNTERPSCSWFIKKSMRHHVRYNGTTGADIQKGGLYILAISSEATNSPAMNRNVRLSFYDN
jgi:hypothetical protein